MIGRQSVDLGHPIFLSFNRKNCAFSALAKLLTETNTYLRTSQSELHHG
jgi:hypothetical protein